MKFTDNVPFLLLWRLILGRMSFLFVHVFPDDSAGKGLAAQFLENLSAALKSICITGKGLVFQVFKVYGIALMRIGKIFLECLQLFIAGLPGKYGQPSLYSFSAGGLYLSYKRIHCP